MIHKIVINNSLTLSPENGYYIQALPELGYKTKYGKSSVLQIHGAKLGNAFLENKTLAVELIVASRTGQNDVLERRNNLYRQLTLYENRDDMHTFDIYLVSGLIYTIRGVVQQLNAPLTVEDYVTCPVSFTIESESPFYESKNDHIVDIDISTGGGFGVPFKVPIDMSTGAAVGYNIYNGGTFIAYPRIYLHGALDKPVLHNETTGETMSVNIDIETNEYVYIDTYKGIAKDHTGNNVRGSVSSPLMTLAIGDNIITLATDTPSTGHVRMLYRYTYPEI